LRIEEFCSDTEDEEIQEDKEEGVEVDVEVDIL
jgi:hypothetical protein